MSTGLSRLASPALRQTSLVTRLCRNLLPIALSSCLPWSAYAFDYSRYEDSSVEVLMQRAAAFDVHESGQSVLTPPQPVHIRAAVHECPKACPDQLPVLLMRSIGIADPPPMGWCMSVKGEEGGVVKMWIQDSIARFVCEEYQPGEQIELWALWLFVNASNRKPYFVVNGIGPAAEPVDPDQGSQPVQPGASRRSDPRLATQDRGPPGT